MSKVQRPLKKRLTAWLLVCALLLGLAPAVELGGAASAAYADSYMQQMVDWGFMRGDIEGNLRPDDPITREQLAVMLYQYAWNMGYDLAGGGMALREYGDYDQISGWALEALDWAVNAGIISGTGDSALSPQGRATRAQTAVMLQKFCELDK